VKIAEVWRRLDRRLVARDDDLILGASPERRRRRDSGFAEGGKSRNQEAAADRGRITSLLAWRCGSGPGS